MRKPIIKIIKRFSEPAAEIQPPADQHSIRRRHERGLRKAVDEWVNERRENRKAETELANLDRRQLMQ
jgi:hypothetical protein